MKHRAMTIVGSLLAAVFARPGLSQVFRIDPPPGPISAGFGEQIVGLADIDGDGSGDFALSAPQGTVAGDPRYGRVFVYSGRTRQLIRVMADPHVTSGIAYGALAPMPDVNGDSRADILIGAVGLTNGSYGYAYVYSGATGEILHTVVADHPSSGANFGGPTAAMPDLDGDGIADFAVSAIYDFPPLYDGRVYTYSGATGQPLRTLSSAQPGQDARFGFPIVGTPDLDGDGVGDIVINAGGEPQVPGQPARGVVYFVSGATGQPYLRLPYHIHALALVPDVNGDGVADIVMGNADIGPGVVWVISGATGNLLYTLQSPSASRINSSFGISVAGVPDIDGDGRGDILIGAATEWRPGFPTNAGPGAAYLVSGATGREPGRAVFVRWA